jgi:NTP pyrophosphatase (non-canonical NTP hydrolase)
MTADAPPPDPLLSLRDALRVFARDRDWEPFHTPKNLAAALSVEASELLEPFQWLTDAQSASLPPQTLEAVRMEMADVLLYLIRMADKLDIDLTEAARRKIELNGKKYPVELARGNATKHTKLGR